MNFIYTIWCWFDYIYAQRTRSVVFALYKEDLWDQPKLDFAFWEISVFYFSV